MVIMVSACLLGENCKYDGGNNLNPDVIKFTEGHKVIPVCPEVMGGLPVPRIPSEIADGKVINKEGVSVDREFRKGAEEAFQIAVKENIDLAILKARSPSCGSSVIYDGTFTGNKVQGNGVFADMLICAGIKVVDESNLPCK